MAFDLHPILDKGVSPRPGLWYAVAPEKAPAARVGATAIQSRESGAAFLCAGATLDGSFSDLHELKISSDSVEWSSLPSSSLPPRYEHLLALTPNGQLLVFAGAHESGPLSDMWTYDRSSGEWQKIEAVSGNPPSPRTLHSSTSMWRGKLVVFSGGDSGTDAVENTIHLFDIESSSWQCQEVTGTPPSPRQGHISAVVRDTLFVHGGLVAGGDIFSDLFTLDLVKMHWSKQQPLGPAPPPLAAHGCAIIGTHLYIFGGLTTNGACDTLYCLDTEMLKWCLVKVEGAMPPCRLDHAMTTITLPFPLPPNSSTVTSSPSQEALVTSTTSHPHLVTVIDPETVEDLIGSPGPNGVKPNTTIEGAAALSELSAQEESSIATATEEADPSLSSQSTQHGHCDTATGMQRTTTGEVTKNGHQEQQGLHTTVTALLVCGGMDTSGHIHSDCFIIVPP